MKIDLHEIPIRDLVDGYTDTEDKGVRAYRDKLDIRPPYQREFVYKDKQRDEVIRTVRNGFPLNILYWVRNPDGTFECLDGQQRMISICQYVTGVYSIDFQYFHNLTDIEKDQILDYKLMVYICEGNDKEKLDWFKTINIAGEKLTDQELRNAIYTGPWLADAKKYFSKNQCAAYKLGEKYMNGTPIRQDYLETALEWICDAQTPKMAIEEYMAVHQNDKDANELWQYYKSVMDWVQTLFPNYRKIMKGLDWGLFYNWYHNSYYNSNDLEQKIFELLQDDDVTSQKGVYKYVLSGDERALSIRAFTEKEKLRKYEEQGGVCPKCGGTFEYKDMAGDHIVPWSAGGHTVVSNLQMLCRRCNGIKSDN